MAYSNHKIIIKIIVFPPPYRGVRIFNERFYEYLLKTHTNFKFFNFADDTPNRKNVIKIKLFSVRMLIQATRTIPFFIGAIYKIFRNYKVFRIKGLMELFLLPIFISQHIDKKHEYAAFCDHLGDQQLIFSILKSMGFRIDIYTYLHGFGILECYDSNPNYYKGLSNLAKKYIAGSRYILDEYIKKKDRVNQIEISPPFLPSSYYSDNLPQKYNHTLFIGSFIHHKNPLYIIEELSAAKRTLNHFKFLFIGEGPLEKEIREKILAYELKNIEIIGPLSPEQTEICFNRAKYLIVPSLREPFGMVIIEAMAKKVVPIVSNCGGMKEIFSEAAGYVFDPKPGELAKILLSISDEDYDKRKEVCYRDSFKYNEDIAGKNLLNILLE
jgi:glycosyltransferase involved in cell wall biosynthesis